MEYGSRSAAATAVGQRPPVAGDRDRGVHERGHGDPAKDLELALSLAGLFNRRTPVGVGSARTRRQLVRAVLVRASRQVLNADLDALVALHDLGRASHNPLVAKLESDGLRADRGGSRASTPGPGRATAPVRWLTSTTTCSTATCPGAVRRTNVVARSAPPGTRSPTSWRRATRRRRSQAEAQADDADHDADDPDRSGRQRGLAA